MAFDEIHLPVTGMTCANCAANIERAVKKLSGIRDASVNFAAETASIVFDPEAVGLREIVAQIERAGYGAQIPDNAEGGEDAGEAAREAELAAQTVKFFVGLALAVPLFVLSMGRDLGIFGAWAHHWGVNWFFFLLATPVQFYTGFDYYVGAFKSLRNRSANMDVLVAMGSSAAYFYSLAVLVLPHAGDHVYFETAAVIIVLIKLGKILETRAKRKTGGAIRHLLDLRLKTASVIADDREEQVPVDRVAQGDILIVRPGGQIPVDGIITEGRSSVDESMFSGEPLPVDKGPNNEVIGGSINRDGVLTFRATRVGRDTALARIVKLVQDAQGSKAPIQALADRVAAVFVPFVMGVAGVTFLIWWVGTNDFAVGMIRLVAVLVIACPCALGLATPTAMMAGMGKGAEAGILFKTSQALETAARLKTIAMDKTGTLTWGRPEVADVIIADLFENDPDALLNLAASVEANSEHPVAKAIVAASVDRGLSLFPAHDFVSSGGSGVEATVEGDVVRIGRPDWIKSLGLDLESVVSEISRLQHEARTVVVVTRDQAICGLIAVADALKSDAAAAVRRLKHQGIRVVMITGDTAASARVIAGQVGIDDVLAEVRPADKADRIQGLKVKEGISIVGMVGDGVNDAPALAVADVGFAIGTGTDVAIETADVILTGSSPVGVPRAVTVSRATMRTVRQNLFWAFGYNVVLIPVAAGILSPVPGAPEFLRHLHPMLAALAMSLSSISVVSNSLLLFRKKIL